MTRTIPSCSTLVCQKPYKTWITNHEIRKQNTKKQEKSTHTNIEKQKGSVKLKIMNTPAESKTMELLDRASPEMIPQLLSMESNVIKEAVFALIPTAEFRLRKWKMVKNLTEEQLMVIVFEYHRDLIADNQLKQMF